METINMTVSGMTCGSCVKHVEKAIHSIAGLRGVEVDLASGAVNIMGNISQKEKEILAALEKDGYPAQISSSEASKTKSISCRSESSCCYG